MVDEGENSQDAAQERTTGGGIEFQPLGLMPRGVPWTKRRRWESLGGKAQRQAFAAIELKCLECCAWVRPDAKACQIGTCPLWALNQRIFGQRDG